MAEDVSVKISADDKPLKEAFDRANKNVNDFGKNAQNAFNSASNSFVSMSDALRGGFSPALQETNKNLDATAEKIKGVGKETGFAADFMSQFRLQTLGTAAGIAVFSAIRSAIRFVKDEIVGSIDAFSQQEDAVNKLRQSYARTGGATQSALDGVQAFATALERNSRFADENIIKQVAFVRSIGATTEQSKEFVKAAANMSATLGGSLEENTEKLAKTLSGEMGRLGMLIPELRGLTEEQLKAGKAAEIINQKYSGASANDLNTYAGSVDALKNSYNNLQEEIGGVIVKNSLFVASVKSLKEFADENNEAIRAYSVSLADASGGNAVASRDASQLADDYEKLDRELKNLNKSLEEQKNRNSVLKFFFDDDPTAVIQKQIKELTALQEKAQEELQYGHDRGPAKTETPADNASKEQRIARLKATAELTKIEEQFEIEKKAISDRAAIDLIDNDNKRNAAEIERAFAQEKKKIELVAKEKEQVALTTLSGKEQENEIAKAKGEEKLQLEEALGKRSLAQLANQRAQKIELATDAAQDESTKKILEDSALEREASEIRIQSLLLGISYDGMEKLREIELQKIENVRKDEIAKAQIIQDKHKQQQAVDAANAKAQASIDKANDSAKEAKQKKELADLDSFLTTASTLQNAHNKELATIGKAAAISQATIKGYQSVQNSYEFGSEIGGPILGSVMAGIAFAASAANIAAIEGVKFEQGGIVPGLNQFGDNVQVRVNPGEVILNNSQQKELLEIANGRKNNSDSNMLAALVDAIKNQVVSVNIDGREIARAVRDQRLSGFAV